MTAEEPAGSSRPLRIGVPAPLACTRAPGNPRQAQPPATKRVYFPLPEESPPRPAPQPRSTPLAPEGRTLSAAAQEGLPRRRPLGRRAPAGPGGGCCAAAPRRPAPRRTLTTGGGREGGGGAGSGPAAAAAVSPPPAASTAPRTRPGYPAAPARAGAWAAPRRRASGAAAQRRPPPQAGGRPARRHGTAPSRCPAPAPRRGGPRPPPPPEAWPGPGQARRRPLPGRPLARPASLRPGAAAAHPTTPWL